MDRYINKATVTDLLRELVSFESPYFHEEKVMEFAYGWLSRHNLSPAYHRYKEEAVTGFSGTNIVGNIQGRSPGKTIHLNGHLDTVTLCEGWTHEPLSLTHEGGKLFGLGALDMKGGCAAMMLAMDAFVNRFDTFSGAIHYSFVSDEEGPYGLGTDALINDGLLMGDFAIVAEPSASFCKIPFPCLGLGARGGISYRIELTGKASHAASPEEGVSAIEDAAKIVCELNKVNLIEDGKLGKGSVCILEISGGGAACSVADKAVISVYRHIVRNEDQKTVHDEIQDAIGRAGIASSAAIHFRPSTGNHDNAMFHPYVVDEESEITKSVTSSIERAVNKKVTPAYFNSIGDFNSIAVRTGIPTYIFGPSGGNYHTADEHVDLESLVQTARAIYQVLADHLGH